MTNMMPAPNQEPAPGQRGGGAVWQLYSKIIGRFFVRERIGFFRDGFCPVTIRDGPCHAARHPRLTARHKTTLCFCRITRSTPIRASRCETPPEHRPEQHIAPLYQPLTRRQRRRALRASCVKIYTLMRTHGQKGISISGRDREAGLSDARWNRAQGTMNARCSSIPTTRPSEFERTTKWRVYVRVSSNPAWMT